MRLALAQINTTVGDLDGNRARILASIEEAEAEGADIVLFPELAVTGYPPEDLLLRTGFLKAAERSLETIASASRDIVCLVGFPHLDRDLFNACAVCANGVVEAVYHKRFLPNYGVFDEDRYFQSGRDLVLLRVGETLIGPTVCEDIWQPGPPGDRTRPGGRACRDEYLGVAFSRRERAGARGDADRSRSGQRVLGRVRERRRRAG